MTPADLESEMERHDVLVVNSPRETFSMVVGQARERGLHVLSTRCGGPETVYQNVRGITYRDGLSNDVTDLAAALIALPLASELSSVEELAMFRPEVVAEQFIQLYRNVGIKI
jgi:glycosyltransferase involved in cell wall biosynthesis